MTTATVRAKTMAMLRGRLALMVACAKALACGSPGGGAVDAAPAADSITDSAAPADAPSGMRVRVATANLRCLLEDWPTRVQLLAEQIGAVDPDLLALQEVCREPDGVDGLFELLAQLEVSTGRSYAFVRTETHQSWDQYQEGIAVVTPHEISDERVFHLPEGVFPRRAVAARVQTPFGAMLFASTHLSFGDEQSEVRVAQLAAARAGLDEMRAPGEPAAIAGDFNDRPESAVISAAVAAGYLDSWDIVHPAEPGPTFPATAPSARIDYILLSAAASGVEAVAAEVFLDQAQGATLPSDHLGVRADLEAP